MRVMVIHSNQAYASSFDPFPPVGTKGDMIKGFDADDECEVVFDDWPQPTIFDESWTVHRSMIVFIPDDGEECRPTESYLLA